MGNTPFTAKRLFGNTCHAEEISVYLTSMDPQHFGDRDPHEG